jgi:cell division septation protein DedD
MKAFVIGEDQIRKAAYAAFAVVILAFVSGYYLGSEKMLSVLPVKSNLPAVVVEKAEVTEVAPLIKSTEKTAKAELKKTQKSGAKKSEHKKADKKKKEKPQKTSKKSAETKKSQKNKVVKSEQVKKTTEVKKSKQPEKTAKKKETQKDNKNKVGVNKVDKSKPVTGNTEKKKSENGKQSPSAGLVNKQVQAVDENQGNMTSEGRVYSIQAGMFASEANARSFIEKLAEKKFDAYASDFVSTSGAIKYNVRVGRFEQRDQARVLLRDFQKTFSSPAYVVITE